jgi:hypothetical protein
MRERLPQLVRESSRSLPVWRLRNVRGDEAIGQAMSTRTPGVDEPKTECPFCGDVWQKHTLSDVDGCMAIMHIQFSVAVERDARQKGKAILSRWEFETCPVCSKTSEGHTENDLASCVAKWRKHELGATGLKLQGEFYFALPAKEESDALKRDKSKTWFRQSVCSCGKARGDHTQGEIRACSGRNRGR